MPIGVDSCLANAFTRTRFGRGKIERHVVAAITRDNSKDIILLWNNVDSSLECGFRSGVSTEMRLQISASTIASISYNLELRLCKKPICAVCPISEAKVELAVREQIAASIENLTIYLEAITQA